jgi:ferredoxin
MKRDIITIDEELCNGCGECVPGCPEGALQIIDGKARLVSDLNCDGLGACIGECPTGALTIERREAEPYDEKKTMENIIPAGKKTIRAHLSHLLDHGEEEFFRQACEALAEHGLVPEEYIPETVGAASSRHGTAAQHGAPAQAGPHGHGGGCPGSAMRDFRATRETASAPRTGAEAEEATAATGAPSMLQQWPVQLHLVSPRAPYFQKADLLLAADCTAFAVGDFHSRYMQGKALAVACPKLDGGQESYLQKLTALIDEAQVNTVTVVMMEVPCCGGLLQLARQAAAGARRNVPIKAVVVNLQGEELREEWV